MARSVLPPESSFRNIAQIRSYLSLDDAKTLIHAFVFSQVDYSNAVFFWTVKTAIIFNPFRPENIFYKIITKSPVFRKPIPFVIMENYVHRVNARLPALTFSERLPPSPPPPPPLSPPPPPRGGLLPPPPRPPLPPRAPPRPRPGRPRSPKLISSWDVMSLAGLRKWCSAASSVVP